MRKFFLLIPALVLSLFTYAAVININTGTPDALRKALNSASDGDIIEMAAGTYVESNSNFIAFDGKNVLVRAEDAAEVIIQPQVPITVANGGCAHFQNVKIDASHLHDLQTWYEHIIYATDAAANNRIILDGCEIYGFALNNSLISCSASNALGALTINNCYFHNINKSCVFIENTSNSIAISITNSTFANITTDAGSYYAGVIDTRATSGSFLVDHCTFYDVEAMNTDYAAIGKLGLASGAVVSNCIFALSTPGASTNRTIRDVVAANNCLVYNYSTDGGYGMQSDVTKTNCFIADPLFTDAANGDFSYAGNWVTMSFSPARGAATDGSDLGDPRWYSAEVLPSTDFAEPYQLVGAKAKLAGKIWYDSENGYIYGDGGHNKVYGTATWKIHASKACVLGISVNLNSGNTSGHKFRVEVIDADGNGVGEFAEETSTLPGVLSIPAVGDYTIILHDDQEWSSAKIDNITLSYIGGDIQAMPGTTNINDAWFSANGTRADGKITYSSISSGCWAKWNINVASAGTYNVTVNIQNEYGHNYSVEFLKEGESTPISIDEGKTTYGHDATLFPVELGAVTLEPGNYEMKVSNAIGDAALLGVKLAYAGGGAVDIPGSINLNDAILSSLAYIDGTGLHFADADHLGHISDEYAKWNIHVAADGMYKFTANCSSSNYSNLTIQVLQSGVEKYTYTPQYTYTGEKAIDSPEWFLESGDYELRLSNPANHSNGYLVSLSAAQVEGILIVDEMATDMQYITDVNSLSRKPLLKRSFTGGMYNTVVFPFNGVSDAELTTIFGAGYELLEMTSAILEGNTLNLNFSAVDLSQATYGRPYLIKPTQDVVNPMFSSKTIYASTSHLVNSSTNADFIGSFIAGQVPAGEDNLFLGPNNLLYFWEEPTPIKGTRAYFHIKGVPHPSQSIKHANIITNGQVATSIDFTKGENNKVMKAIENGQLIIIRNGERFTVQGQRIQ